MLCLNNFIVLGVANDNYVDLNTIRKVLESTGFKVKEIDLTSFKVIIAFQNENCTIINENIIIALHGIFLDETLHSLLNKVTSNFKGFLEAYRHQGSLAIIDKQESVVYVVEDPGATRTIFYFTTWNLFIISTDMELLKNTAEALGIRFEPDILALYEILMLGSLVSRKTIYNNVNRLLPGEYIVVKLDSDTHTYNYNIDKYWDVTQLDSKTDGSKKTLYLLVKTLISLLNTYCKEAQDSKLVVPISGGIDSSLLLFLTTKAKECKHVQAIHINLNNSLELLLSRIVALKAKTPLHIEAFPEQKLRKSYFELLRKMLRIIGYPREGDAALPYLILAQTIKSMFGEKRVFSLGGEGSDPIFGGSDYYKFFATQLILEKRIAEFLKLMKTIVRYNFEREKTILMVLKPILQLILRSYRIRYIYFKLKSRKLLLKKNRRLNNLIAQYFAQLSGVLYNGSLLNYYRRSVARMLIHKISHVIHTRVKAEESQGNIIFLPFASRDVIEISMMMSPEYYFFPVGSRSILRLLLKYFGAPSAVYLQFKSGFSATSRILKVPSILSYMKAFIEKCWVHKYVAIHNLNKYEAHNMFNVCISTENKVNKHET